MTSSQKTTYRKVNITMKHNIFTSPYDVIVE